MAKETTFEGWAIIELFGHNQIAGLVSEATLGGGSFVRVDVPEIDGAQPFTKFYGPAAIYSMTPTTEEIARLAASKLAIRPVSPWIVPIPNSQKQLAFPGDVWDAASDDEDLDEEEQ